MPRLFHLADLHLGRMFHGESLLEDQAHVLNQVIANCLSDPPDAVVLAGDIYDRAIPPAEAMNLLDRFLSALSGAGVAVVMIPGNHDSPGRLAYASGAWETQGIHIRAGCGRIIEPVCITGRDRGKCDIWAVPFVEPARAAREIATGSGPDPPPADDAVAEPADPAADAPESSPAKVELMRTMLDSIRAERRNDRSSVLVAHEFVAGSVECGSERIYVGGGHSVPAELLAGFDYVALGHLHSPQRAGDEFIRYSGAPLAYAFDETGMDRGYLEVAVGGGRLYPEVVFRPLSPLRPLHILTGTLEELLNRREFGAAAQGYVSARVTDGHAHLNLIGRLRDRFPFLRELRQLSLEAGTTAGGGSRAAAETPETVFADYLDRIGWTDPVERSVAAELFAEARSGTAGRTAAGGGR